MGAGAGRPTRRLLPLLAMMAVITSASSLATTGAALAVNGHTYCNQWALKTQTCPPYGSSEWHHLLENAAESRAGSLCIDEYLDPSGATIDRRLVT
jgi:hypothetical protein